MPSVPPGRAPLRDPTVAVVVSDRRLPLRMRAGQVRARIVAGPPVMGVRKRGAVRRFMLAMLAPPMMLTTLRMRARQRSA